MKKTIASVALLFVALSASVLLQAQAPPEPPDPATEAQHHVAFLTKMLTLTDAQKQQATTIFTNAAKDESGVRKDMKSTRQSLDAAIKSNNIAKIKQISTTIGSLTAKSTSLRAEAQAAFYQILTADQQKKLDQFESSHHRGPGGPGGPGGSRGAAGGENFGGPGGPGGPDEQGGPGGPPPDAPGM